MSKTSTVYTRVEPEIKERAEQILTALGIPMSNAVNLFLHQVVLRQGIPFEIQLPRSMPLDMSKMTREELDAEIQKGIDSMNAGRVTPAEQVWAEMDARFEGRRKG